MNRFMLGKKIGMTQLMKDNGEVVPVTLIAAGPMHVLDILTEERNGYSAIKVGYEIVPESKCSKPKIGQFKKASMAPTKYIREFRVDNEADYTIGQTITIESFSSDDKVDIQGKTMGRGYSGTIKRWNFQRGPMSHGSKSHRIPGSIGGGTSPGRVIKGKKMAGQYGNETVTIKNLRVAKVDVEKSLLYVVGAVPGKPGNLLVVSE
jgi:large subunit ribosomal protein L3